jgi:tRNA threonylcarbamoyl adenosine modification protein (Sua5/YciO/YrdC/YwlC family)
MATIVPCDAANITRACQRLSEGYLVAFPTETVYGLGANALNADAVLKIFHFKGRPATDPLIVHVTSLQSARRLIKVTAQEELVLQCMADAFWPGPLTCVVRASDLVPPAVTSGRCARCPLRNRTHVIDPHLFFQRLRRHPRALPPHCASPAAAVRPAHRRAQCQQVNASFTPILKP